MPSNRLQKTRQEITDRPQLKPYASKVDIILGGEQFGFDGESCLLLDNDLIIRIIPKEKKKFEFQKLTVSIEGFAKASEAEEAGLKFAMSVLWTAVSLKCPLRLEYHTPLPCVVYDRTLKSEGLQMVMQIRRMPPISGAGLVTEILEEIFTSKMFNDDDKSNSSRNEEMRLLLLSMELFASARLEATERTRFIGLVSALEPLAKQKQLEYPNLNQIIQDAVSKVKDSLDIPENVKRSIIGSIGNLKRESVSQAIYRLLETHLPGDERALKIIKEAYTIRSKLLHEGFTDADLSEESNKIENIIRRIYAAIVGHELRYPAQE